MKFIDLPQKLHHLPSYSTNNYSHTSSNPKIDKTLMSPGLDMSEPDTIRTTKIILNYCI